MHNVRLHVDDQTTLGIRRLRGELIATRANEAPFFDDKTSFRVRLDSAEIAIDTASLSHLLNDYVFHYDGSPFRQLRVTTVGRQLRVAGVMHKGVDVPFAILADARVDRGQLRLHPTAIKALGVPATGLMSFFGVEMDRLVKVKQGRGVALDGDDFVLSPGGVVPPPRIEGTLQAVRIEPGRLVQIFGPGSKPPLVPPDRRAPNYMYYHGGVLRFGKLTMTDADLQLIDEDPRDPFDFFQDHYNDQLVAGYSKNTPAHGLKVYMPDFAKLLARHR